MFKSARWRADKNKITAIFKLRFHATQVSQLGGNVLVLSLVPADTGKPTAKLDKFEIQDGCCHWESPIFETVKLIQDQKTGKIQEKIYYFIISTGTTKLSILGEVSVNIAEFAEAIEAASVSLPFKGSNSDVILHVLIQRIQENGSQRELDTEGAILKPDDEMSLRRHFSNAGLEEMISIASPDSLRKAITNTGGLTRNIRGSIGSDITLSSSDTSSGLNTPRELGMKNNVMLLDSVAHNQEQTGWELALVPIHDLSTDQSTNSPRNAFPNGRFQQAVDDNVDRLKSDLVLLSRKAEVTDLELQTLRKQIVKESRRGHELLKEVGSLKEERDILKEECEKLQGSQKRKDDLKSRNKLTYEEDPWALLDETRQELNYVKDLNVNLQLQLQKTQESNSELILAVQDLEEMLQQCETGNYDPSPHLVNYKNHEMSEERSIVAQGQSDDDEEQKALEEIVRQHSDAKESYVLEQRLMDLCSEVEMYRRDKDELEVQLEQLALDYEILKQENHDMSNKLGQGHQQEQVKLQYECSSSYAIINELENRVQKLERELKERSNEFERSLATIKELETHTHNLEDELDKQALGFKGELEAVTSVKVEKDKQAIRAEEALGLVKVELKNRAEKMEDKLKKKSKEYTQAIAAIRELTDDIQVLEDELDKMSQGFESDLEAVIRDKVEQEQRAIRAEESLRLARWKNANIAGRLQDEFKRVSMQLHSEFEANEKLATNAKTEASELQLINMHLEDLLQKAKEELQSVKNDYEAQVLDLRNQLSLKATQIDQLLLDNKEKSNQLDHQRKHGDEVCQSLSAELLAVRAEMDRLTSETASLIAQIEQGTDLKAELEQMKALVKERDSLALRERSEIENLEDALDSAKRDAQMSMEELIAIRCLKNEKDMALLSLQSEVDILGARCEELQFSLCEDDLEKEELNRRVLRLEDELSKKDDALNTLERQRGIDAEEAKARSEDREAEISPHASKEADNPKEHVQLLEEAAPETSEKTFAEKEKDLHDKIEELKTLLAEKTHSSPSPTSCECKCRKVDESNGEFKPNGIAASINKTEANGAELSTSTISSMDQYDLCTTLKEMASLREKNTSMESELKEMQDRYSEISLKFAEVEGERQKLMMTIRSIKNSKRR